MELRYCGNHMSVLWEKYARGVLSRGGQRRKNDILETSDKFCDEREEKVVGYDSKDLKSTLKYIKNKFGIEVFAKQGRVPAILSDLAPALENDRVFLERMSRRGLLEEFVQAEKEDDISKRRLISNAMFQLTEKEYIRAEIAAHYLKILVDVFEWKVEVPLPKESSAEEKNTEWKDSSRSEPERIVSKPGISGTNSGANIQRPNTQKVNTTKPNVQGANTARQETVNSGIQKINPQNQGNTGNWNTVRQQNPGNNQTQTIIQQKSVTKKKKKKGHKFLILLVIASVAIAIGVKDGKIDLTEIREKAEAILSAKLSDIKDIIGKKEDTDTVNNVLAEADNLIEKGSLEEARKLLFEAYNKNKNPEIQEKLDEITAKDTSVQTEKQLQITTENLKETEVNDTPTSGIHRYEYCLLDGTWEDAYRASLEKGGHLVTFETQEEYDYITRDLSNRGQEDYIFFIGGRRELDSRQYYWVDSSNNLTGSALNRADAWNAGCWLHDEPSFEDTTLGLQEHVLSMFYYDDLGKWVWNDVPNDLISAISSYSGKVGYICEYED